MYLNTDFKFSISNSYFPHSGSIASRSACMFLGQEETTIMGHTPQQGLAKTVMACQYSVWQDMDSTGQFSG